MNRLLPNYSNNEVQIQIIGNWGFINDRKNTLKKLQYYWNSQNKTWCKKVPSKDKKEIFFWLKNEYVLLKNSFSVTEIDFESFKYSIKAEFEKKEDPKALIEYNPEVLPENIRKFIMPHQIEGIKRFINQGNKILLAWSMGCLSGDTIVTINVRGSSKKLTLLELYNKWNRQENKNYKWNYKLETKIRSFNFEKNIFQLYDLTNVMYSGKKETIKLYFSNDTFLICTKDHKIFTDNGWIEADNLTDNDNIYSNGIIPTCKICGSIKNIRITEEKYNRCCYKCYLENYGKIKDRIERLTGDGYIYVNDLYVRFHPYKQKSQNGIPKHRLIYEAYMNGYTYDIWIEKIINNDFNENDKFLTPNEVIHHKDRNKLNNDISNLEYCISDSIHKKIHAKDDNYANRFPIMIPKKVKLIKKVYNGIIDTFDLTVKDSECFVANNILVHNCGKTFGSLSLVQYFFKKSIIILPKSLISQWKEQIIQWGFAKENEIFVYDSDSPILYNKKFNIFNYEKFRFIFSKDSESISKQEKIIYDWLLSLNPKEYILVYDETYKIKNYKSKLFKAHQKLRSSLNWFGIIGLSGTPGENSLMDFYTILNFIEPYCITWQEMQENFIYQVNEHLTVYRNLKKFNELASKVMHRVLMEDVRKDLPPLTQTYRFVEHSKEAHELADILKANCEHGILEIYTMLKCIDSYFYPTEELKKYELVQGHILEQTEKYNELIDILEEIDGQQILIFTQYARTAQWLKAKLIKEKYKVEIVTGETHQQKRDEIRDCFVEGKLQIVIATSTWMRGVDLPTINYLCNWDLPFTPSEYQQRIYRIFRLGSSHGKVVVNLVSDVIENDVYQIIKDKMIMSEIVVEGESEENVARQLEKRWGIVR